MADDALTVPLAPVLDEYVRMNSDLTLMNTQLRVLLAEQSRELENARAEVGVLRGKMTDAENMPTPWPYEQPPGGTHQ
jgi:hypothetical protein